ncbi:thioredoxin family protein [Psychroflexus salis]|uniref:Thioredoxin n=1 Tax=Psychroflexus salis TaxID=1526574 RepID=A0A917E5A5_9FLAO|nr:thioredoxin family protein [Psychroflexus salis]GGE05492.1 thioredoxin [Psychroflexus salis]
MNQAQIIEEALTRSYAYSTYKTLINQLFEEGKTTGETQTQAFLGYTKLGIRRMKRWDKTAKLSAEHIAAIQQITTPQTWIVITEAWCGDAAHALPIIAKLSDLNLNINLRIVLRDENEDLMNAFLTNGKKSIAKMIGYEPEKKEVLFTWGPRPKGATSLFEVARARDGEITPEVKEELQMWFNKDKGKQIAEEVVSLALG